MNLYALTAIVDGTETESVVCAVDMGAAIDMFTSALLAQGFKFIIDPQVEEL